jgi:hypothetical protein
MIIQEQIYGENRWKVQAGIFDDTELVMLRCSEILNSVRSRRPVW